MLKESSGNNLEKAISFFKKKPSALGGWRVLFIS